jgi:hypothetical protein
MFSQTKFFQQGFNKAGAASCAFPPSKSGWDQRERRSAPADTPTEYTGLSAFDAIVISEGSQTETCKLL